MYARSPASKRARQAPSHSISTYHHTSSNQTAVPGPARPTRPHGQTDPHINPTVFRPRDMTRLREERREQHYRDSKCYLCSTGSRSAYHTHFSTADLRVFALLHAKTETFLCPFCKVMEPAFTPIMESRRVVLTGSTLYGVWDQPQMPTDTIHFDMEAIVGGRVRDMRIALEQNYLYLPNRLEIIIIAGINNIGEGQKAEEIVQEMIELKEVVEEHSKKYQHNLPNYVSFCTLILPPKFCSLHVPNNPPEPWLAEWVPGLNFRNKFEEIKLVNEQVKQLNLRDGLKCVDLAKHGVKMFKSGTVQHKFDNKPGATQIWREKEVFRKLHFTMENKMKILSYISNCFRGNAGEPQSVSGHV